MGRLITVVGQLLGDRQRPLRRFGEGRMLMQRQTVEEGIADALRIERGLQRIAVGDA